MRVAYFLATPPAPKPDLDAAVQEAEGLCAAFGGEVTPLYPGRIYRPWTRRSRLRSDQQAIWLELDRSVDLHHVVSDRALDYPLLRTLKRPVVYRLLTPIADLRTAQRLARHGPLVVSSPAEARLLERSGVTAEAIPPGLDLDRFASVTAPPESPFTLLFASAPWTRRQFNTKGLDALLAAVTKNREVRLVVLWRGVLEGAMERRIEASGAADRIELITETVAPESVLGRVHATVLAPSSPRVVKAYPHSLVESLAAGRPVITSAQLAIADWVNKRECGIVCHPTPDGVGRAVDQLQARYQGLRAATLAADLTEFSNKQWIERYRALYERTLGSTRG